MRSFYEAHAGRQGIAVLAFQASSVNAIENKYRQLHPRLVRHSRVYDTAKVLEVYAYYKGDSSDSEVDTGTVLRFVEPTTTGSGVCLLPGILPLAAHFDDECQAAYCDHWVSNGE